MSLDSILSMHRNKAKLIQGIQTYHVVVSQRANRERQFPDIAMLVDSLKEISRIS